MRKLSEDCVRCASQTRVTPFDVLYESVMVVLQYCFAEGILCRSLSLDGSFVAGPEDSIRRVADFGHIGVSSPALHD